MIFSLLNSVAIILCNLLLVVQGARFGDVLEAYFKPLDGNIKKLTNEIGVGPHEKNLVDEYLKRAPDSRFSFSVYCPVHESDRGAELCEKLKKSVFAGVEYDENVREISLCVLISPKINSVFAKQKNIVEHANTCTFKQRDTSVQFFLVFIPTEDKNLYYVTQRERRTEDENTNKLSINYTPVKIMDSILFKGDNFIKHSLTKDKKNEGEKKVITSSDKLPPSPARFVEKSKKVETIPEIEILPKESNERDNHREKVKRSSEESDKMDIGRKVKKSSKESDKMDVDSEKQSNEQPPLVGFLGQYYQKIDTADKPKTKTNNTRGHTKKESTKVSRKSDFADASTKSAKDPNKSSHRSDKVSKLTEKDVEIIRKSLEDMDVDDDSKLMINLETNSTTISKGEKLKQEKHSRKEKILDKSTIGLSEMDIPQNPEYTKSKFGLSLKGQKEKPNENISSSEHRSSKSHRDKSLESATHMSSDHRSSKSHRDSTSGNPTQMISDHRSFKSHRDKSSESPAQMISDHRSSKSHRDKSSESPAQMISDHRSSKSHRDKSSESPAQMTSDHRSSKSHREYNSSGNPPHVSLDHISSKSHREHFPRSSAHSSSRRPGEEPSTAIVISDGDSDDNSILKASKGSSSSSLAGHGSAHSKALKSVKQESDPSKIRRHSTSHQTSHKEQREPKRAKGDEKSSTTKNVFSQIFRNLKKGQK